MQKVLDRVRPDAMPQAARGAWEQLNALIGDASFVEVFAGALESGISQEQIDQLEHYETGPFSAADKAVLRVTDLMRLSNQHETLPDELAAALKQHFSAAEICELGVVTAVISGMAKLSFVMDLVEREDNCSFA